MDKAAEAFRTISEVAEELDVPQHVLRFWETRFAQIKPMKRGGGRRYYRPGDVDLLKGIRHLLYDKGYTIRGVQRILRERGNPHVAAIGRGEVAASAEHQDDRNAPPAQAQPPGQSSPATAGGPVMLSAGQVADLELSLVDLAAARRILAGAHKTEANVPAEE